MEALELLACQMTESGIQETFWTRESTHVKHTVVVVCTWQVDKPLL